MRARLAALSLLALGLSECAHQIPAKNLEKAKLHFEIGVNYLQEGKAPEALAEFQNARNLNPENPGYQMHLGLAYLQLEKMKEAKENIRAACLSQATYPECWNNLSYAEFKDGRYADAAADAKRALATDTYPTPEAALGNLARADIELQRYAEAKKSIDKALRLQPQSCQVRYLQSLLFTRQKAYEDALIESKRTVLFCKLDPLAHLWVAYGYYRMGQRPNAEAKYNQIIELFKRPEVVDAGRTALEKLRKRVPLDEPKF